MPEMTDEQLSIELQRVLAAEAGSIQVGDAHHAVSRVRVRSARGRRVKARAIVGVAAALVVALAAGGAFAAWRMASLAGGPGAAGSASPAATESVVESPLPSGSQAAPTAAPSATATPSATTALNGTTGKFVATGSMVVADGFFATRLIDGRVLVLGESATSAEIYDPATGTFSRTGKMISDLGGATATRLDDGRVLVAGGTSASGNALASAELYDPGTGKFSPTGSMNAARNGAAASLLSDGRVLITGGMPPVGMAIAMAHVPGLDGRSGPVVAMTGPDNLDSAELYDPATGKFTMTGSMSVSRRGHTSTLLADGRVLIAGGAQSSAGGDSPALDTAELYNPATGRFVSTGTMTSGHDTHTATLLQDGRVLIAGGVNQAFQVSAAAELYDPVTGKFSGTGSLAHALESHTATLLPNGQVLVAGGYELTYETKGSGWQVKSMGALASAELYDPTTGRFENASTMTIARTGHTATLLLDGRVLIAGGVDPAPGAGTDQSLSSAETYLPLP
jgi:hypothetical protein